MASRSAFIVERRLLVKADVDRFPLRLAGPHRKLSRRQTRRTSASSRSELALSTHSGHSK